MKELSLEECKQAILNVLADIDTFCNENQIHYSLCGGTLLGAVRHKGFIPWDDDVDILMVRKEYEKFCRLYKSNRYTFVDSDHVPNHLHIRVADNRFKLVFNKGQRANKIYKDGLWVDVFPVDNVPDNPRQFKRIKNKVYYLFLLQCVGEVKGYGIVQNVAHFFLRPFTNVFKRMAQREIVKYNDMDTKMMAGLSVWYDKKTPMIPSSFFDEYITVPFEGYAFQALKRYGDYLKMVFGDYMQLPPVDKRVAKHDYIAYEKDA